MIFCLGVCKNVVKVTFVVSKFKNIYLLQSKIFTKAMCACVTAVLGNITRASGDNMRPK